MNEQSSFERLVADQLANAGVGMPPESAIEDTVSRASGTRRDPRWLAMLKESPMRTNSRLAVGSPTVRVAAVMLATLLLSVALATAGVAGQRLLAADATIVVDPSGAGDYTTIADAVAAAQDGDEVLIKPGTYDESVVIEADIRVRGEDRDGVIIRAGIGCSYPDDELMCPDDLPLYGQTWLGPQPFAFVLEETDATIADLTVEIVAGAGIIARGGAPAVQGITYLPTDEGIVYVHGGSAAVISDSDFADAWVLLEERSPATIERSTFGAIVANTDNTNRFGGPAWIRDNVTTGISFNGETVVTGNEVTAPTDEAVEESQWGQGIDVHAGDGFVIEGNTVVGFDAASGIVVQAGRGTIRGNELTGNLTGIAVLRSAVLVQGNTLSGNRTGIALSRANPTVEGNTLIGNTIGINGGVASPQIRDNVVDGGEHGITFSGDAQLVGNTVEHASVRGIEIDGDSEATLQDNRSCANGEDLWIADTANPDVDPSNDICDVEA